MNAIAFLMVTHDDRLVQTADRILRIEDGYIREARLPCLSVE